MRVESSGSWSDVDHRGVLIRSISSHVTRQHFVSHERSKKESKEEKFKRQTKENLRASRQIKGRHGRQHLRGIGAMVDTELLGGKSSQKKSCHS